MEDGLVHCEINKLNPNWESLNPCCSGRWSRTRCRDEYRRGGVEVLILVVVEDGLVHNHVEFDDDYDDKS